MKIGGQTHFVCTFPLQTYHLENSRFHEYVCIHYLFLPEKTYFTNLVYKENLGLPCHELLTYNLRIRNMFPSPREHSLSWHFQDVLSRCERLSHFLNFFRAGISLRNTVQYSYNAKLIKDAVC